MSPVSNVIPAVIHKWQLRDVLSSVELARQLLEVERTYVLMLVLVVLVAVVLVLVVLLVLLLPVLLLLMLILPLQVLFLCARLGSR